MDKRQIWRQDTQCQALRSRGRAKLICIYTILVCIQNKLYIHTVVGEAVQMDKWHKWAVGHTVPGGTF